MTTEAQKEYQREWKRQNKDKVTQYSRKYRETHHEHNLAYLRAWREANPDKIKQYRERYWQKKQKMLEKSVDKSERV